jgi:hypothetical protein
MHTMAREGKKGHTVKLEIELTTAQVAMLEFLRARRDMWGPSNTNEAMAQQLLIKALVQEFESEDVRHQWAYWCVTGTFPPEGE